MYILKNHKIWTKLSILDKCAHIWIKVCKIVHMQLHHFNDCCHFNFLENLKINK